MLPVKACSMVQGERLSRCCARCIYRSRDHLSLVCATSLFLHCAFLFFFSIPKVTKRLPFLNSSLFSFLFLLHNPHTAGTKRSFQEEPCRYSTRGPPCCRACQTHCGTCTVRTATRSAVASNTFSGRPNHHHHCPHRSSPCPHPSSITRGVPTRTKGRHHRRVHPPTTTTSLPCRRLRFAQCGLRVGHPMLGLT